MRFLMAGGGTGGHVIPALAVARELKQRGHEVLFVGTRNGLEARLVPEAGFPIEWIEIGGLNRVGAARMLRTLGQLPASTFEMARRLGQWRPAAVFSMGGYVAGPVTLAAWLRDIPIVLMEPNAVPGLTNRWIGRVAARSLIGFEETASHFPRQRSEVAGVPIRPEFFEIAPKARGEKLSVLITGGSRGSRTLNNAARMSWPLFRQAGLPVWLRIQTGAPAYEDMAREFDSSGIEGEVTPFIDDMPAAFTAADLIVCRSGAGAVAELAAAGKPAILVPFPFAADNHQQRNAEALASAGAARVVLDSELDGRRLVEEVTSLAAGAGTLERMGMAARSLAREGAAARAADLLEELGKSGRFRLT
jgi:UDP-N-acetylglucosamine--N-acetylmuramyl-(pentapeptide) pyrophosphoryl-undecaprenol N-acetylglucosamine transferase